jgi:serine/threonine protein phosphatase 1
MKVFVMGDIHGAHKALVQCLERSGFNKEEDVLIQLGDVADGWNEVYECVEELLTIKKLIPIMGNHDQWWAEFLQTGQHPSWQQGGLGTLESYCRNLGKNYQRTAVGVTASLHPSDIPDTHRNFFLKDQVPYFETGKVLFVHAGIDREKTLDDQLTNEPWELFWDRELWKQAQSCAEGQQLKSVDGWEHIYIGHTQVYNHKNQDCKPLTKGGVTNLDTGAGWNGKLTMMDIKTKEIFQSDFVKDLYPDQKGRG